MEPLYIPSTDTMIHGPKHRYIHPTTGEVYGHTDYDDPKKLAEIGAIPLVMVEPKAGKVADGWQIVVEDGTAYRRPLKEVDPPLPTAEQIEEKRLMDLEASDMALLKASARSFEDLMLERVAEGKFVAQKVKDIIAERVNLRK
jgi:hypothetical protein